MKKLTSAALCLLALTLSRAPAAHAEENTPAILQAATQPDRKPPVVKLKSAGKAPLKQLRYTPVKGSQEKARMVIEMNIDQTLAGKPVPRNSVPAIQFDMLFNITDVADNGDISYSFEYTDVDIIPGGQAAPQTVEIMGKMFKSMVGMGGKVVVNNRGIHNSIQMHTPKGMNPLAKQSLEQMQQSLDQFGDFLPEEAVGVGAVWEIDSPFVATSGMTLHQTVTMTILEIKGNLVKCKSQVKQTGGPQNIASPFLPARATVQLKSLTSQANGETNLSLTSMWPAYAQILTVSQSEMTFTVDGNAQDLTQKINMTMTLSDGTPPAAPANPAAPAKPQPTVPADK
jgi:hypothetical protein